MRKSAGAYRARHGGLISLQRHRDAVTVTCPEGHSFKVQSRDGALVKCSVCWQRDEITEWVLVRRPRPEE